MEDIKILQIVGFKNSGKTTLLGRFIEMAAIADKQVATIKHHGHSGELEMPEAKTDSMRFFDKGAASSLAFGNGVVQLHIRQSHENLQKFINLSLVAEPDLILIEGFKQADFPKVVLVRSAEDWEQLKKLSDIRLVITGKGVKLTDTESVELDNQERIEGFFAQWMVEMEGEKG